MLVGHGRRERQVRGPTAPGETPTVEVIRLRRYRCRACRATVTVAPRGLVRKRLFSGSAMGYALALWGVLGRPAREVRRHVSPWQVVGPTSAAGWVTLKRWVAAVRDGRLFRCVRAVPDGWGPRQVAERAATTLASHAPAPREGPLEALAFNGAAQAA